MNDVGSVLLSVRAEARQLVAPDYAILDGHIEITAGSKAEAMQSVASAVDRLTADLGALGGMPLDHEAHRHRLTWSVYSASTQEDHYRDQEGRVQRTGQVTATAAVRLTVRDLGLLDVLGGVLAAHHDLTQHAVTWHVDWDNPAWPRVRAEAIRAAIGKAHDYAAALGAAIHHVEHVADTGLLGGETGRPDTRKVMANAAALGGLPGEPGTSVLNPVPLELIATIDARVRATGLSLLGN